jgi:hypothetical protein
MAPKASSTVTCCTCRHLEVVAMLPDERAYHVDQITKALFAAQITHSATTTAIVPCWHRCWSMVPMKKTAARSGSQWCAPVWSFAARTARRLSCNDFVVGDGIHDVSRGSDPACRVRHNLLVGSLSPLN